MANFTAKKIEYETILKTDYVPDFVTKINVNENQLRESILSLYNNLHIAIDGNNGSIGIPAYPVNINAGMINTYSTGDVITFNYDNSPVGYVSVDGNTGDVNIKCNSINVNDITVGDNDLTFGSETKKCDLSVIGLEKIDGGVVLGVNDIPNDSEADFIITKYTESFNLVNHNINVKIGDSDIPLIGQTFNIINTNDAPITITFIPSNNGGTTFKLICPDVDDDNVVSIDAKTSVEITLVSISDDESANEYTFFLKK